MSGTVLGSKSTKKGEARKKKGRGEGEIIVLYLGSI